MNTSKTPRLFCALAAFGAAAAGYVIPASRARGSLVLDLQIVKFNTSSLVWQDRSGNGNNATVVGGVSYNGYATPVYLGFNPSDNSALTLSNPLSSAAFEGSPDFTMIVAANSDQANKPNSNGAFFAGTGNGAAALRVNSDNSMTLTEANIADVIKTDANVVASGFHIFWATYGNGQYSIGIDGTTLDSGTSSVTFSAPITEIGGAGASQGFLGGLSGIQIYDNVESGQNLFNDINAMYKSYVNTSGISSSNIPVPEPTSFVLLAIPAAAMLFRRRRSTSA